MTPDHRLEELRADARYRRERLDLYRAKSYGPRPTTPGRLRELEREYALAADLLRRAETEESEKHDR